MRRALGSGICLSSLSPGDNRITFYSDGNGWLHGNRVFRRLYSAVCGVVMEVTYYCRRDNHLCVYASVYVCISKTAWYLFWAEVSTFKLKTANIFGDNNHRCDFKFLLLLTLIYWYNWLMYALRLVRLYHKGYDVWIIIVQRRTVANANLTDSEWEDLGFQIGASECKGFPPPRSPCWITVRPFCVKRTQIKFVSLKLT